MQSSYIAHPALGDDVSRYAVPTCLGNRAGVMGALELARLAYESEA